MGEDGLGEVGMVDLGEGRLDWVRREGGLGEEEKATVERRREGHLTAEEAGVLGEGEKT